MVSLTFYLSTSTDLSHQLVWYNFVSNIAAENNRIKDNLIIWTIFCGLVITMIPCSSFKVNHNNKNITYCFQELNNKNIVQDIVP